jgi:hypothetical protein
MDVACSVQYWGQIAFTKFFSDQLMQKASIAQEAKRGDVPNVSIDSSHNPISRM